jgi:hypothetical protein
MANNTIAISIVAEASKAQAAFRQTGASASSMGTEISHSGRSLDEFGESAGTAASTASQAAGAFGDLGGALAGLPGPLGLVGKGMEALQVPVMALAGASDLLEVITAKVGLAQVKQAAASVTQRVATVAGTVATYAATAATAAFNAVLALNPVTLIVIAIAALIAIVVVLAIRFKSVRNVLASVWDGLKSGALAVVDFFRDMPGKVLSALEGLADKIRTIGGNIVAGLLNGFLNAVPGLRSAIEAIAGILPDWIKKPLGISSPARALMPVGKNTALGIKAGFASVSAKDIVGTLPADLAKTKLTANGTVALSGAATGAAGGNTYTVNVHVAPTADKRAIGKEINDALAAFKRGGGVLAS